MHCIRCTLKRQCTSVFWLCECFLFQLNQIEKVLFVVKDQDGYDVIKKSLDDLKEETEKWIKTNFDQWRDQCIGDIATGDLT